MNWYLTVLKKYAVFRGRARRKEYWFFALFNILISIGLVIIDAILGTYSTEMGMGFLSGIYSIAIIIPGLAVTVRRLHDTEHSGWWILICLIPLIGVLVLLVFMLLEGNPNENKYGPDPKAEAAPA